MWVAAGHHNPVWRRLMPLRLADCFLLKSPLPLAPIWVFEAQGISTENMGTREHKIQIMEMIYNTNTLPVFRHTRPKSMGNWGWWLIPLQQQTFVLSLSPSFLFFFLYPLWAGKRTVTLALFRAGQQAEWLGVNHSFVSLSWHIKLERRVAARTARVRDGRTTR